MEKPIELPQRILREANPQSVIRTFGVPFDLCSACYGSRLGPGAIRLAGLHRTLEHMGLAHQDSGDIHIPAEQTEEGGIRNFGPLLETLAEVRSRTAAILEEGNFPLILGGDQTVSMATIGAALEHFKGNLAVLWIDAHADLNTPATSPSGNLHGMCLSALTGMESGVEGLRDQQWKELQATIGPVKLRRQNMAFVGLRHLDVGERAVIWESPNCLPMTMQNIDRVGMLRVLEGFNAWMSDREINHLWISFDIDAMDPIHTPGTGTPAPGGLSYREAHLLAEMLYEFTHSPVTSYRLVGLDLTEVVPTNDYMDKTSGMTVEWTASLFGTTILGER